MLNHSGHVSMIDDAGTMNDVAEDFFNRVERSKLEGRDLIPDPTACGPIGCTSKYKHETTANDNNSDRHLYPLRVVFMSFLAGAVITYIPLWSSIHRCLKDVFCSKRSTDYEAI
jgi:hypothetical protein